MSVNESFGELSSVEKERWLKEIWDSRHVITASTSASALRAMTPTAVVDQQAETINAGDYDDLFIAALRERESEHVGVGYGKVQHPTARLFEIGVDSIRAGAPSELFLTLLEKIGSMAEERDVMAELFPEDFPRRIKTTTVRAAQRETILIDDFKAHISAYLKAPRTAKFVTVGKSGGALKWKEPTFSEAVAKFKTDRNMRPDEEKAFERALKNHGTEMLEWRDHLAALRQRHW